MTCAECLVNGRSDPFGDITSCGWCSSADGSQRCANGQLTGPAIGRRCAPAGGWLFSQFDPPSLCPAPPATTQTATVTPSPTATQTATPTATPTLAVTPLETPSATPSLALTPLATLSTTPLLLTRTPSTTQVPPLTTSPTRSVVTPLPVSATSSSGGSGGGGSSSVATYASSELAIAVTLSTLLACCLGMALGYWFRGRGGSGNWHAKTTAARASAKPAYGSTASATVALGRGVSSMSNPILSWKGGK